MSPCSAVLDGAPSVVRLLVAPEKEAELRLSLSYRDEKLAWALRKFKKASWYADRHGTEAWKEEIARRQAEVDKCLLFADRNDPWTHWTWSGLARKAAGILGGYHSNQVVYSDPDPLPWKDPGFEPYPFQLEAEERLIEAGHAAVELATGLGKSYIILRILKRLGLRAVVMAPYENVALQLYDAFREALGERKVGFFGGGVKKPKLVTVAIAASLVKVEEGSKWWKELASSSIFVADESHLTAAETLSKVCMGLMAAAPYRFFFSATQLRTDGLDLLLEGITGPVVSRMDAREGISKGYLAALDFAMVKSSSGSFLDTRDAMEMAKAHLYYNPKVNAQAAAIVNGAVAQGRQALVLVDEIEQFGRLLPGLRFPARFAHGPLTSENKRNVPEAHWESCPKRHVKEFNAGEFPILVGTSCISTGTDVKANEITVNLQGGKSRIAVMQGPCGRSTRIFKFSADRKWGPKGAEKRSCTVVDFDVANEPMMHRHAAERRKIYESIAPVRDLSLGAA